MAGVRSFAHCPKSVQRGNAQRRGEITVRTAAHGGFTESKSEFRGGLLRLPEKPSDGPAALHGRTIDAAADLQFAGAVQGTKVAEFAVHAPGVLAARDANVYVAFSFRGNDIDPRASPDDARVDGNAAPQIRESRDTQELRCQLENRALTLLEVESRMGGASGHLELVAAYALARRLELAFEAVGRFADQDRPRAPGQAFGEQARRRAANFFITHQKNGDRPRQPAASFAQGSQGEDDLRDTGLHVEHARSPKPSLRLAERHGSQCSDVPDRIVVAEQQDGSSAGRSEIRLDVGSVVTGRMPVDTRALGAENFGQQVRHLLCGCLRVTGRFLLHEAADEGNDRRTLLFNISEQLCRRIDGVCRAIRYNAASARHGIRVRSLGALSQRGSASVNVAPLDADEADLIHPTAIIDASAKIDKSCRIGPYCVIGAEVEIGPDCELMSHVVVHGPTRIGRANRFFPFAAIGIEPQDVTYRGEPTRLEMGDENVIREYVTLNRGTVKGGGVTRIGNHVLIMAYSHVGHDCQIGDNVMLVNCATLAGHVTVEDWAVVGAMSPVHQFTRVGQHAYIGGGTIVTQDVLPFSTTSESRENRAYGLNSVGLKRRGFTEERLSKLHHAYRVLLGSKLNTSQAVAKLRQEGDLGDDVETLLRFIETSERGIIK